MSSDTSTPESPPSAPPEHVAVVANRTNQRLEIQAPGSTLVFAPLERRALAESTLAGFDLAGLEARNLVAIAPEPVRNTAKTSTITAGGVYGLGGFLAYGFVDGTDLYWAVGAALIVLLGTAAGFVVTSGRRVALRWAGQIASLATVVALCFLLPGAAIYFGTDLHAALFGPESKDISDPAVTFTLFGRGLQLLFIAAASLLPGLLFYLFDRFQLGTLRDRFTRQIFRLDPAIDTVADVEAKYGALMDEVYGSPREGGGGRLLRGTRWPILMATLVIAMGWSITLLNRGQSATLSDSSQLFFLFEPRKSAFTFAFLGAYFYALGVVLRGYVRGDLRPKSYSHITVRILVAVILAWVLELFFPDGATPLLVIAFVAGIVPETALIRIQESMRDSIGTYDWVPLIHERHPLTRLQGIDLYDRARLLDEGVTNVEGLAHHDLIELMLQTRIPVPRLVDWTDQAILYLHVGEGEGEGQGENGKRESALDRLRGYGIRTATDLETAWKAAKRRGGDEEKAFLGLLPSENGGPGRIRTILDAMSDEEWLTNLRYWHDPVHLREHSLHVDVPAPPAPALAPAGT